MPFVIAAGLALLHLVPPPPGLPSGALARLGGPRFCVPAGATPVVSPDRCHAILSEDDGVFAFTTRYLACLMRFATREAASAQLRALGADARPQVEAAVKSPNPEVMSRARAILAATHSKRVSVGRSVDVLEGANTEAMRALLKDWAASDAGERGKAATAALSRMR